MAEDLVVGDVYRINSRNLILGVFTRWMPQFDGSRIPMFIGIREKFGWRYLTEEYGWNPVRLGPARYEQLNENDKLLRRSLAAYEGWQRRKGF